jgi:hypothetical protein
MLTACLSTASEVRQCCALAACASLAAPPQVHCPEGSHGDRQAVAQGRRSPTSSCRSLQGALAYPAAGSSGWLAIPLSVAVKRRTLMLWQGLVG